MLLHSIQSSNAEAVCDMSQVREKWLQLCSHRCTLIRCSFRPCSIVQNSGEDSRRSIEFAALGGHKADGSDVAWNAKPEVKRNCGSTLETRWAWMIVCGGRNSMQQPHTHISTFFSSQTWAFPSHRHSFHEFFRICNNCLFAS